MSGNIELGDIILENRKKASFTGISDVESFDEEEVFANSACGNITIRGSELKICRLSVETGDMIVEGKIDSISYDDIKTKKNIIGRLFG